MHVLVFVAMLYGGVAGRGIASGTVRGTTDSVTVGGTSIDTAITWRYDLRAGDHLVYREVLRQEIDGSAVFGLPTKRDKPFGNPFVSAGRYEWSSQLLVLRASDDRVLVGVQRNRARDDSIATSLDTTTAMSAADRARLASRLVGRER